MIPLFVGYAMLVWVIAARHRREVVGYTAVALGFIGLLALNWLHGRLSVWTGGTIHLPVLRSIMYPYTGLVAGVGLFIAVLPKRSLFGCIRCAYDLEGLETVRGIIVCPECGEPNQMPSAYRRSGADRLDLGGSDAQALMGPPPPDLGRPSSADRVPGRAEAEDQEREPADQAPPQRREQAV